MVRASRILMAIARDISRAQRQAENARAKAARENDKIIKAQLREEAIQSREQLRSLKEQARYEKERYFEKREQEAADLTSEAEEKLKRLRSILADTLLIDDKIDFDTLRIKDESPVCYPPPFLKNSDVMPVQEDYIQKIPKITMLKKLIPGSKGRYEKAVSRAKAQFQNDILEWQKREDQRIAALETNRAEHARRLQDFDAKKTQRNAEVDIFEVDYRAGEPNAIVSYSTMVLERSSYPEDFPQVFSIAYMSASQQLVVEYQLPNTDIVPIETEFRYVRSQDKIVEKQRKLSEIKELYQDIIAATALRTIHEIFESDHHGRIEVVCFNGYIHTIDPSTGQNIQPHLISVRTTREKFQNIDLSRVDKAICLKNLGAQISRRPEEAQPVKPIIEFKMADARFVDQTDLVSGLSSAKNLMELTPFEFEQLVANLFGQMGLESKLTRSSRDGGVDCVAFDRRPVLGGKVVIQAKRYRNTVGVSAVRDLYGTMMNEGANKGILVSTSGYEPDAFNFAKDKPIELIDGGNLLYLLQEIGFEARIVFPEE